MTSGQPSARVSGLYRYPVKGLGPQKMDSADLPAGGFIAADRAYAIEDGPSGFDPQRPAFLRKTAFLCLMKNAALAALKTRFSEDASALDIEGPDGRRLSGRLDEPADREALAAFIAGYVDEPRGGEPRLVQAPGHTFADAGEAFVSIINLASVAALGREMGHGLDPLRFRGNVHVEGIPAFAEFGWVGRRMRAGSGAVLEGVRRIKRCAATSVDPETGIRDLDVPRAILSAYGHLHCGIYARVVEAGTIRPGDALDLQ